METTAKERADIGAQEDAAVGETLTAGNNETLSAPEEAPSLPEEENAVREEDAAKEPPYGEESEESDSSGKDGRGIDYAAMAEEDFRVLSALYPEVEALGSIAALSNRERFAELRELGLSPEEAYRATRPFPKRGSGKRHMTGASARRMSVGATSMPYGELEAARGLFPGLSSSEILSLYKRCTK